MDKVKVGIIGCGNICDIYFKNLCNRFDHLEVKSCADLMMERAQAKATAYGVAAVSVDELLADPEIEIVLNLTIPKAHYEVCKRAIDAGKSVHVEKPLALNREDGKALLDAAEAKGVLIGAAPDTFLGAGHQACRKVLDDGVIGEPVAATAFMMGHGHESWHPDPEFYYELGGGPMLDMGPYYVTALVNMIGPVRRVTGSTRITFPTRTITSEKKNGKVIEVETPTHQAAVLDFANGAVGTMIMSFDVWGHHMPCIEVYGTKGSMVVPDPNSFGGEVLVKVAGEKEWKPVPLEHAYAENSRGVGPADMALALREGRKPRAGGDLAYHALDIMLAVEDASNADKHVELGSTCERPEALPVGGLG